MIALTCLVLLQSDLDRYVCLKPDGTVEAHGMELDDAAKQFWAYVKAELKEDTTWCVKGK